MVAVAIDAVGSGTLTASGPGVVPSVTVTEATANTGDIILLTPTNEVRDANGTFQLYVSSISNGASFVVKSRAQLPASITFNYAVFTPAS